MRRNFTHQLINYACIINFSINYDKLLHKLKWRTLLGSVFLSTDVQVTHPATSGRTYAALQRDCHSLCDEFPDLFKDELGCLSDFELEVKFKFDA